MRSTTRTLALQRLLVDRRLITDDEVTGRMTAMDENATLAVEFGGKPEHLAWRHLRRKLQEEADDAAGENTP